jgi:integrase
MAKKPKRPELTHCKVSPWSHPRTPWRVWYSAEDNGQKVRLAKAFTDEDAAWTWAEDKDRDIQNHGIRFGDVPPEARRAFDAYRDLRAELETAGVAVPDFGQLVADALKNIRLTSASSAILRDVVESFIEAKASERKPTRHLANLRANLARFCDSPDPLNPKARMGERRIAAISTAEVERYLWGLRSPERKAVGPVTRAHHLVSLRTCWRWAVKRNLAPVDATAPISRPKAPVTLPEAYSPQDTAKIFKVCHATAPDLLPALSLVFFAGLRPSEAAVVKLETVDFKSDDLRIEASKTGPRVAHLTEAARAWIAAQPRRSGPAWKGNRRSYHEKLRDVLATAKVQAIHDGGRHSFITYRTAETRNPALVADECGNSPAIIRKHYRAVVGANVAERYFAIRPAKRQKAEIVSIAG